MSGVDGCRAWAGNAGADAVACFSVFKGVSGSEWVPRRARVKSSVAFGISGEYQPQRALLEGLVGDSARFSLVGRFAKFHFQTTAFLALLM